MLMRALLLISLSFFLYRRQRRYLRYLQQDDYNITRFLRWIKETAAFDTRGSIVGITGWISPFLLIGGYPLLACFEKNPANFGKKPLVKTLRSQKILFTALFLEVALAAPLFFMLNDLFLPLLAIALCQTIPLFLALSVLVLSMDEKKRQKKFLRKAHRRILEVNPRVIGITGSYGKTTTKHFLSKLLNMTLGPTFHPAKGVNTPMGITREINERLRDKTSYAVVEMAAYGPGSISRLCRLTPPQGGVLTTIGLAHLERFASQDTIRKTKAELAHAVPKNGFLILNGDDPHCRLIGKEHPKDTMLYYGFNEELGPLDLKIFSSGFDRSGSSLQLTFKGRLYECKVPVYGKPLLANLGSAFLTACHLGADPDYAASALSHCDTVANRLQVQFDGGITYIHDAYNSNPSGFESALTVLKEMPAKRRLLMTPGMVELGSLQYSENERVVSQSAVDIALIVGATNRKALESGLLKSGLPKSAIHFFATRDEAFHFFKNIKQEGDALLIENDLLDLYEAKEGF